MRILILNHNQENFGTYFRCRWLGEELSDHGNSVVMVCASGKDFDLAVHTTPITGGFSIITLPRIKYARYFTGQLFRMFFHIYQVLFYKYDICYAFAVAQPQIGIPALLAKVVRGKKLVVDWDDLWGGGFAQEHASLVAWVLGFFERFIPKFADRITYVSEFIQEELKKLHLKVPMHKIPNGCNTLGLQSFDRKEARIKLHLPEDKKLVVSVGNTYTDSLGLLLAAFKQAGMQKPELRLVFIGNLVIEEKFKPLFEELKDVIIKYGSVPYAELARALSAADSLVLPMDSNSIEKARFPMRFGDYLCGGRPIVSNAVGEVKYYIEKYKCGYVSAPEDINAFAQNILNSVKDIPENISMCKNARLLAERELNWKVIGHTLNDVLLKLF